MNMAETVKKWFYAGYAILILIIIAENIWFGKGHLIRYNMIALWTIFLIFAIFLEGSPSPKDGISFYILILIMLIVHGVLIFIIRDYFVSKGL